MKRSKFLLPLIALTPVATIAPGLLASCSSNTSKFTTLQYGDDFTIAGGDHDAALIAATRHLPTVNVQQKIEYTELLGYLSEKEPIEEVDAPVLQMDPTYFYWEIIYTVASNKQYLKLTNWNINIPDNEFGYKNYRLSFKFQLGNSVDSQIQWGDEREVQNVSLPYYEVNKDEKVYFRFKAKDTKNNEFDISKPSYTFKLVTIHESDEPLMLQKWDSGKWVNMTTTDVIELSSQASGATGFWTDIAMGRGYRWTKQCEFSLLGEPETVSSIVETNNMNFGVIGWEEIQPPTTFNLMATPYLAGEDNNDDAKQLCQITIPLKK